MNKITKMFLSTCVVLIMKSNFAFGMMDDDRSPAEYRAHKSIREQIERPIRVAIPEVARGYEEIYERFLKGVLVYRPWEGTDAGKIEMPIAALTNPLEGTFDLSRCGDKDQYLSIATGYRKGQNPKNVCKAEIWITPRFLVDQELPQLAPNHHMKEIIGKWHAAAPIGIFWTSGGWNDAYHMSYCTYLTVESMEAIGTENLLKKYQKSDFTPESRNACPAGRSWEGLSHFVFELNR